MKIYTKTGDQGMTALIGGVKISKSDLRIDAYGEVDELNAYIGLLNDLEVNEARRELLKEIQDRLFTIGANLALAPDKSSAKIPDLSEDDVVLLENTIDAMQETLPSLRHFVLPGGHLSVSYGHIARTVCRRAERTVVRLMETETVDPVIVRYLNRLSDFLFVLSRIMGREVGAGEIYWVPRR